MIPVGMGKQEMVGIAIFLDQFIPKPANTSPRVNNDNIIALGPDFQAGRITAVLCIIRA